MAVMLGVKPQLDEAELAELAARIRTTVREAVHAGITDALTDITPHAHQCE